MKLLTNMNTPPRTRPYRSPSSDYVRAPRRPTFEQAASPPRLRPFDEYEDLDVENEKFKVLEAERQRFTEVIDSIGKLDCEHWLLRGPSSFRGGYPSL